MSEKAIDLLKEHPDFSLFDEIDFREIEGQAIVRNYKKGQILFDNGDERSRLFFISKGLIKLEKSDSSDTFYYLNFIRDGHVFPYTGLLTDDTYYFSAIAVTDIEVIYIPMKLFEKLIKNNNEQLIYFINKLSNVLKRHELKIQNSLTSSAFYRIKNTLSIFMHDLGEKAAGGTINIPYSILINDISKCSGTTRETTSSIMKQFINLQKISYFHKQLIFLDVDYFTLDDL